MYCPLDLALNKHALPPSGPSPLLLPYPPRSGGGPAHPLLPSRGRRREGVDGGCGDLPIELRS